MPRSYSSSPSAQLLAWPSTHLPRATSPATPVPSVPQHRASLPPLLHALLSCPLHHASLLLRLPYASPHYAAPRRHVVRQLWCRYVEGEPRQCSYRALRSSSPAVLDGLCRFFPNASISQCVFPCLQSFVSIPLSPRTPGM